MSESENKRFVQHWFEEVWNRGRADLIDELRAPDIVATGLGHEAAVNPVPDPFKAFYYNLRETFPDIHVTVEDMVAEGDKVAARVSVTATHTGNALAPSTGNKVAFESVVVVRIVDGLIAEAWNHIDMLGILHQIGALPEGRGPARFVTRK